MALEFDNLAEGLRTALQSENCSGAVEYAAESEEDFSEMSRLASKREEMAAIVYEEEIPLAIQVSTSQDMISSCDVEYYFTPEEYARHGYEHVIAVTARFSQKKL